MRYEARNYFFTGFVKRLIKERQKESYEKGSKFKYFSEEYPY